MAKITRALLKVFGDSGANTNFGKFGSEAAGSGVKTKDIATIQALSAWINGWQDAINSTTKAPYLEDMNSAFFLHSTFLAYLLQEGIAEWETGSTYYIGSIVKKTGTTELYSSLTNSNQGNALGTKIDTSNWKYLGDLNTLRGLRSAAKRRQSNAQSVNPASSATYVNFDHAVDYDLNGDFSVSTYFKAPIAGYYQVNASVAYATTQSGKDYWISLVNDVDILSQAQQSSASTSLLTIRLSDILYMAKDDKLYCTTNHNSDTSKNTQLGLATFMSVALLY